MGKIKKRASSSAPTDDGGLIERARVLTEAALKDLQTQLPADLVKQVEKTVDKGQKTARSGLKTIEAQLKTTARHADVEKLTKPGRPGKAGRAYGCRAADAAQVGHAGREEAPTGEGSGGWDSGGEDRSHARFLQGIVRRGSGEAGGHQGQHSQGRAGAGSRGSQDRQGCQERRCEAGQRERDEGGLVA
jgi:hypothetical protein